MSSLPKHDIRVSQGGPEFFDRGTYFTFASEFGLRQTEARSQFESRKYPCHHNSRLFYGPSDQERPNFSDGVNRIAMEAVTFFRRYLISETQREVFCIIFFLHQHECKCEFHHSKIVICLYLLTWAYLLNVQELAFSFDYNL